MRNALIALIFQLGWLACVLSGARDRPLDALVSAAAVTACNLWLQRARPAAGLRVVAWAALVGLGVESVNRAAGVYALVVAPSPAWLCPLWLLALWVMFSTLLRGPLAWLSGRYVLSAVLGALFAAPNYFAGARLGAVTMSADTGYAVVVLSAGWSVALPLLVWTARE
jgi:hypothetical protein